MRTGYVGRLRRTVLRYAEGAVLVDTDFQYNLAQLLARIRPLITLAAPPAP